MERRKWKGFKLNAKGKKNIRRLLEIIASIAFVGWLIFGYWFIYIALTGGGM